jgi:hypothetical protein
MPYRETEVTRLRKIEQATLSPSDRAAIEEAVARIRSSVPVERIVLYGSQARADKDEASRRPIQHSLSRARESLESARAEAGAGRLSFSVNRCYFAAFYAVRERRSSDYLELVEFDR